MIICFDLDGTLCSQEKDYHKAKPFKERILRVNQKYNEGHTIIIDTARGSQTGKDHNQFTALQLKRWGVQYHKLRCGIKYFATLYVDDKAITDKHFFND